MPLLVAEQQLVQLVALVIITIATVISIGLDNSIAIMLPISIVRFTSVILQFVFEVHSS